VLDGVLDGVLYKVLDKWGHFVVMFATKDYGSLVMEEGNELAGGMNWQGTKEVLYETENHPVAVVLRTVRGSLVCGGDSRAQ
jgi:hypothetical protein